MITFEVFPAGMDVDLNDLDPDSSHVKIWDAPDAERNFGQV